MTRKILFILTLLTSQFVKSQVYKPFDFDNGEWYCRYETKGGMFSGAHGNNYAIDTVKFFCMGDTIIKDTFYKKLYFEGYTSSQIVPKTYISGYYGAIRNDIENKRVWFQMSYNQTHPNSIIYDFNVLSGDSICNKVEYLLPVTFYLCGKLEYIDSVNYCNKYLKRYNFENNQKIIEGIGSDKGLFPVISSPWNSTLLCYNEKNNTNCEPCQINTTSVFEHLISENSLIVTQLNDNVHISSEYLIESVELVDYFGKYVYKSNRLDSKSTDIYVAQKGLFIARVKVNNKIFVKKIIII